MPAYDYDCAACGPFTATRPMIEYAQPATCPGCGTNAPRAIGLPSLPSLDASRRRAYTTNERSAHAPTRTSATHASGCACCKPRQAKTAGSRPWMISH